MAHKKAGGSTRLGRDSRSQRLGVKLFDGQFAKPGAILVRQRGTKIHPGNNVKRTNDDTLISLIGGIIKFNDKKVKKFHGKLVKTKFINIIPAEIPAPSKKVGRKKRIRANVTKPTKRKR